MKRQILLLFSFMVLTILSSHLMYAQSYPPTYTTLLYGDSDDYNGEYWPDNTNISEAKAMDDKARIDNSTLTSFKMTLFEGCDLKVGVNFGIYTFPDVKTYLKFRLTSNPANAADILRSVVSIPDSVLIPPGSKEFDIPYKINHIPDELNGAEIALQGYFVTYYGYIIPSSTDHSNIFSRFTYNIDYSPRTVQYKGHLRLNVQGGTPSIVCSLDGGYTWIDPHQEFTGASVDKALDAGVIYIKEPNSCHLATIPFGKGSGGIGDPGETGSTILRAVTMPHVANAIVSREQGTHYVSSMSNFVFTIQPTGANAGMIPVITTNRTSIPDSEGVKIEDNGDESYTVTILHVQQPITLYVDFSTGNEAIDNGNKVWAEKDILFIRPLNSGIAHIYNTASVLVKSIDVSAGETTSLSLPAGFYLVKTGNDKVYKIVLR